MRKIKNLARRVTSLLAAGGLVFTLYCSDKAENQKEDTFTVPHEQFRQMLTGEEYQQLQTQIKEEKSYRLHDYWKPIISAREEPVSSKEVSEKSPENSGVGSLGTDAIVGDGIVILYKIADDKTYYGLEGKQYVGMMTEEEKEMRDNLREDLTERINQEPVLLDDLRKEVPENLMGKLTIYDIVDKDAVELYYLEDNFYFTIPDTKKEGLLKPILSFKSALLEGLELRVAISVEKVDELIPKELDRISKSKGRHRILELVKDAEIEERYDTKTGKAYWGLSN